MDTITLNVPTLPCVGLAAVAGLLACKLIAPRRADDAERGPPPAWLDELEDDKEYERIHLPEWDNGAVWRRKNGFKGSDYVHGARAAVHVPRYYLRGVAGGVVLRAGPSLSALKAPMRWFPSSAPWPSITKLPPIAAAASP